MIIIVIKKVIKNKQKTITATATTRKWSEHCDHTKLPE